MLGTTVSKCVTWIPVLAVLVAVSVLEDDSHAQDPPGLTADLTYDVDLVQPGDTIKASIVVHGYSEPSLTTVPFDVMLAIDMSGSMEFSDPHDLRLFAAEYFLDLCRQNSPTMGGDIRAGVIGFRALARLEQDLTHDYDLLLGPEGVVATMHNQSLGMATNIADAMVMALDRLQYSPQGNAENATRVVILLTDGNPEPDPAGQAASIADSLVIAYTENIRVYTIGLSGNAYCNPNLSGFTGGLSFCNVTAADLEAIFGEIFDHASHEISTANIRLRVELDTDAVHYAGGLQVPDDLFYPDDEAMTTFANQGRIEIRLGQLSILEDAAVSFNLGTNECLPVDSPLKTIEIWPLGRPSQATVTYSYGANQLMHRVAEESITCQRLDPLQVKKEFDPASNTVKISLRNGYMPRSDIPDYQRTFTDIHVCEYLGKYYQYPHNPGTQPLDPKNAPRIFIPRYNEDFLYWHINTLGPEQTRTFTFRVNPRAWKPRDIGKLLHIDHAIIKEHDDDVDLSVPGDSRVYYTLPLPYGTGEREEKEIPQCWHLPALLPDLSEVGGRSDLYITPPLSVSEFFDRSMDLTELVDRSRIAWYGPWPLSFNVFEYQESPDIFIDSEANGYVADWSRQEAIQPHLDNAVFYTDGSGLSKVIGQGDRLKIDTGNRIYFNTHNIGTTAATINAEASILKRYTGNMQPVYPEWIALGNVVVGPTVPASESAWHYIEIPAGTVQEDDHTGVFGTWLTVEHRDATIRIEISPAPNEAHTNNNAATEKLFVLP
jgi:hypothetical protein